ncbi:MAG: hypothetical protein KF819_33660 [Labilithrix sp.]|nr:hypothetical protein [Labilithrix sp.]
MTRAFRGTAGLLVSVGVLLAHAENAHAYLKIARVPAGASWHTWQEGSSTTPAAFGLDCFVHTAWSGIRRVNTGVAPCTNGTNIGLILPFPLEVGFPGSASISCPAYVGAPISVSRWGFDRFGGGLVGTPSVFICGSGVAVEQTLANPFFPPDGPSYIYVRTSSAGQEISSVAYQYDDAT